MTSMNNRMEPGEGPLHIAIKAKHTDAVELLLVHGADPNRLARTSALTAPLMYAVVYGNTRMIKALLDRGANINRYQCIGLLTTALFTDKLDIAALLLENGADSYIIRRLYPSMIPLLDELYPHHK